MIKKLQQPEGFTLIELLIVLLLLGVLAVIIIPIISSSTEDAKLNTLKTNISRLRKAIDLYYVHHGNTNPGVNNQGGQPADSAAVSAGAFVAQLTQYTGIDGKVSVSKDETFRFGPYFKGGELPPNPFNNKNDLICDISTTDITQRNSDGSTGWKFYRQTGGFMANDGAHDDI